MRVTRHDVVAVQRTAAVLCVQDTAVYGACGTKAVGAVQVNMQSGYVCSSC
jgi:hypothetical protein